MKVIYRLYGIRKKEGMSLRKLEELSGVSKTTINNIESQNYNPTVLTICMLAEALNISPCELFYIEK